MPTYSSILAWKIPWSLEGYSPQGHKKPDMAQWLKSIYMSIPYSQSITLDHSSTLVLNGKCLEKASRKFQKLKLENSKSQWTIYIAFNLHLSIRCCLENPMDRGAWWTSVHRVTKSRTRLKQLRTHKHTRISSLQMTKSVWQHAYKISANTSHFQ